MVFSDIFADWFPLLFAASFIVTGLVYEAGQKGYLSPIREPSRGEAAGLLLLLGFNFLVFFPITIILLIVQGLLGTSTTITKGVCSQILLESHKKEMISPQVIRWRDC